MSPHQEKVQRREHREAGRIKYTQMIKEQLENCESYQLENALKGEKDVLTRLGINRKRRKKNKGGKMKGMQRHLADSFPGVSLYSSEAARQRSSPVAYPDYLTGWMNLPQGLRIKVDYK